MHKTLANFHIDPDHQIDRLTLSTFPIVLDDLPTLILTFEELYRSLPIFSNYRNALRKTLLCAAVTGFIKLVGTAHSPLHSD